MNNSTYSVSGLEILGGNQDLHRLFLEQLSSLYSLEKQLVEALPKWIREAQANELKLAVESHRQETEDHIARLEKISEELGEDLRPKTCATMETLVAETTSLLETQKGQASIDAAIIGLARMVEHYEIAAYEAVHLWARQLGYQKTVVLLQDTLDEENAADLKLADIANSLAIPKAAAGQAA